MSKVFVLDTNVLIRAGKHALYSFEDNEVVIPFLVIEELEKLRNKNDSVGKYARSSLREIEKLTDQGDPRVGIHLETGGILRIEMNHVTPPLDAKLLPMEARRSNDARLLTVAYNLTSDEHKRPESERREVVLVTDDVPLRIHAKLVNGLNFSAESYQGKSVRFSGLETVEVSDEFLLAVQERNGDWVDAPKAVVSKVDGAVRHVVNLTSPFGGEPLKCLYAEGKVRPFRPAKDKTLSGVTTKSIEQSIAQAYLLDDAVEIVSISGKAGSGKTMLAVAAGLHQSVANPDSKRDKQFQQVLVYRPMIAVGGQEVGYLPGALDQKMEPWKQPVYDSVQGVISDEVLTKAREDKVIDVESITYIRGRTLKDTFLIVDEAQNFSEALLLEIQSRLGSGSKMVLLWDSTQRDNPNVGYNDGPVSYADKMKRHDMFAHISLKTSQRSKVADIAGRYLEEYFG